jgi:hypothetical protein
MNCYNTIVFQELKNQYNPLYNSLPLSEKICVLKRLVPGIRIRGDDCVALNPKRNDSKPDSFKIDIEIGKFNDSASGDKGGDIIDLAVFFHGYTPLAAARSLSDIIGSPSNITRMATAANAIASCPEITPPAKKKKIDLGFIRSRSALKERTQKTKSKGDVE